MKIDPHTVLRLLGVDAGRVYPTATDCPRCRKADKLEIRSPQHITCFNCHFAGDLVQFYAHQEFDGDVIQAIQDLQGRSLLDYGRKSIDQYVRTYDQQQRLQRMFQTLGQEGLEQIGSGAVACVFEYLGVGCTKSIVRALAPHAVPMLKTDLERFEIEVPRTARSALTDWGNYRALAIPSWNEMIIAGFWAITSHGRVLYVSLNDDGVGTAFARTVSFRDQQAIILDDIIQAVRLQCWAISETGRPQAFVTPYGLYDTAEHYRCGKTIYWSPSDDPRHAVRALQTLSALLAENSAFGSWDPSKSLPCGGSFAQFQRCMHAALPAHQALAYRLLRVNLDEGRAILSGVPVEPSDRARILSFVQGDDARHVAALFDDTSHDETITWDGVAITDTVHGWVVKGKLISSAKLYIEQVRPQGADGEAVVVGSISYTEPSGTRHNLRFNDKLSRISKNTAEWLRAQVVSATGCIPYIDSRWSKKLIEIAQQFHMPKPVLADQQYGWSDGRLRMPNFTVDANGVHASPSLLEGPAIPTPTPLSEAEWGHFANAAFCRTVLVLLGNLRRTQFGHPGIGIMLVNEPHVVSRLATAMGTQVVPNPTTAQVQEQLSAPLPLFSEWSGSKLHTVLRETHGYRNLLFSTDSHTVRVASISPDWVRLKVGSALEYGALRVVFQLLPAVIRQGPQPGSDAYYRELAEVLQADVQRYVERPVLHQAALDLDQHSIYRNDTAATRIIELVFYGIERGDITPVFKTDRVRIDVSEFLAATASPHVPMLTVPELTDRLKEARFLIGWGNDHWDFSRSTWDLNASLLGVS